MEIQTNDISVSRLMATTIFEFNLLGPSFRGVPTENINQRTDAKHQINPEIIDLQQLNPFEAVSSVEYTHTHTRTQTTSSLLLLLLPICSEAKATLYLLVPPESPRCASPSSDRSSISYA